jgi:16S rRNA (cytosine967-C5)-methyltransferase
LTATPARVVALDVLRAVRHGALADHALHSALDILSPRDRAWTQELVYGVLRLRGRLDHILAGMVHRPLASLEADVLDILRLGAYQLAEMRSVPGYAAVSQSVELAKRISRGTAGLVNGVLQSFIRSAAVADFPRFEVDPVAHLRTWGSHPEWLVRRWIDGFGAAAARQLVEANNARPALYLCPIGRGVDVALAALAERGIEAECVADAPDSIRLISSGRLADALAAANAIVQDPAAALVVRYVAPPAGSLVADLCAAPGGKAIPLSTGNAAAPRYVLATDDSVERVRRLVENTRRTGPLAVGVVVADARRPALREADVVLLDVPCTGTGTFRRRPDARWRIGVKDLDSLVRVQAELLDAAARIVPAGGVLVYATCSVEPEENEEQVHSFLSRSPEFRTEAPASIEPRWLDAHGWLRVLPHLHGFDGAFAARMRRS